MATKLFVAICLFAVYANVQASPSRSAKGRMAISVLNTDENQAKILKQAYDTDFELDFWTRPRVHGYTDIMIPKSRFNELRKKFSKAGMEVKVKVEDVEKLIHDEFIVNTYNRGHQTFSAQTRMSHSYYRTFDNYITDLKTLADQFPSLMSFDDSGSSIFRERSVEGRIIHYYELTNFNGASNKPVIFLEVLIHAREWITGAAVFYMTDYLLNNYGTDADAQWLLDNFHFVILPVANPDGYIYSHSTDRLWRKNRRSINFFCAGVDLNRNFDANWAGGTSCTSQSYSGTAANSEPETRAIADIYENFRSRAVMYLSVHSYSQIILLPWGYLSSSVAADSFHQSTGERMADAMQSVSGMIYEAGTPANTIGYSAAGTSMDWALLNNATSNFLALAYELRPDGGASNGFVIGSENIEPSGQEFIESVIAAAEEYSAAAGSRRQK